MSVSQKKQKAREKRRAVTKRKKRKKRIETMFNLIPLVVVGVITLIVLRSSFQSQQSGPPAPDFDLFNVLDNRNFALRAGGLEQIILLEFFKLNCPDCITQNQLLLQLRAEFGPDIVIVTVSAADTKEQLLEYVNENEIRWFVAVDPEMSMTQDYEVTTLPTTLLIDRDHRIVTRREGVGSFEFWKNEIGTLLKEQPRVLQPPAALVYNDRVFQSVSSLLKDA